MKNKILTVIVILLCLLLCFADNLFSQPLISFGLGKTKDKLCVDLNAGYEIKSTGTQITIGAKLTSSNIAGRNNNLSIGQNIYLGESISITPSIGIAYYSVSDMSKYNDPDGLGVITEVKQFAGIGGLEMGYNHGPLRMFAFGKYCKGTYAGIGLRMNLGKAE